MKMPTSDHARFDARLPKAQKEFFEKAAFLGGFRSLTDFIKSKRLSQLKNSIYSFSVCGNYLN